MVALTMGGRGRGRWALPLAAALAVALAGSCLAVVLSVQPVSAQPVAEEYSITDLGTLDGPTDSFGLSYIGDINSRGQIVGSSEKGRTINVYAFLWEKGKMISLATLGGSYSEAYDIDDRGQVVGLSETVSGEEHAFLWRKGKMIDLGTLPGADHSGASGINNRGQIVGESSTANSGHRAVLWTK